MYGIAPASLRDKKYLAMETLYQVIAYVEMASSVEGEGAILGESVSELGTGMRICLNLSDLLFKIEFACCRTARMLL